MKTLKTDTSLMTLLRGVTKVSRLLCKTNMGELMLCLEKGSNEYYLSLDSVPLDKETNKEVMDLLFPVPPVSQGERIFKDIAETTNPVLVMKKGKLKVVAEKTETTAIADIKTTQSETKPKKKLGRPKKDGKTK